MSQGDGGEIHLGDGYLGVFKAFVEVPVERLPAEDVEEDALDLVTLDAHGVDLVLRAYFVFLCGGVEYFQVGVRHAPVVVHQFVDHVLGDDGVIGQCLYDDVSQTSDGLASHSYVNL